MAGRLPLLVQQTPGFRMPDEDFDLPNVAAPGMRDMPLPIRPHQLPVGTETDTIEGMGYPGPGVGEADVEGAFGSPMRRGQISYGGPRLNTEAALAGLKSNQRQANPFSDWDLQRMAARDTQWGQGQAFGGGTAPGASNYWAQILKDRQADEGLARAERLKQVLGIEGAMSGMHPAVQAGQEAEARRKAYPAQAAGMADVQAAQVGAMGRQQAARTAAQGRRAGGLGTAAAAAIRGLTETQGTQFDSPEQREEALQQIRDILESIYSGDLIPGFEDEVDEEY